VPAISPRLRPDIGKKLRQIKILHDDREGAMVRAATR
jgi:hypothetical protein